MCVWISSIYLDLHSNMNQTQDDKIPVAVHQHHLELLLYKKFDSAFDNGDRGFGYYDTHLLKFFLILAHAANFFSDWIVSFKRGNGISCLSYASNITNIQPAGSGRTAIHAKSRLPEQILNRNNPLLHACYSG